MDEAKPSWQSKSLWVSAITAALPVIYPPAAVWVAAHPEIYSALLGSIFAGLRIVTKSRLSVL